jgi:hypothetical protein
MPPLAAVAMNTQKFFRASESFREDAEKLHPDGRGPNFNLGFWIKG